MMKFTVDARVHGNYCIFLCRTTLYVILLIVQSGVFLTQPGEAQYKVKNRR